MNIEDRKIYLKTTYLSFLIMSIIAGNIYFGTTIGVSSYFLIGIIYIYLYLTDYLEFNKKAGKFRSWVISMPVFVVLSSMLWSFSKSGILFLKFFMLWFSGNLFRVFLENLNKYERKAVFIGVEKSHMDNMEKLSNENMDFIMLDDNGEMKKLKNILSKNSIGYIVAEEEVINSNPSFFLELKLKGHRIYFPWQYQEELNKKIDVKTINDKKLFYSGGFEIFHDEFQRKIKRIFDVTASILLGLLTLPVVLVAAVIVKLESPGPVIFRQDRVGYGGKEFTLYKFRSMRNDAEKDGPKWASKDDPRATRFGRFIRKTRVDELPQLWNIFKGDMSFIGPRPERKVFVDKFHGEIPFYSLRHSIKPGLTGWAQVMYPYGASIEDAVRKLEYDLYYIKHQDFMLDFMIIFKTLKTVVFGRGR